MDSFHDFVDSLISVPALHGATVVIVSSAGGVYGGSPAPPFDSSSPVRAINQYGLNKIAIEEHAVARLTEHFHVQIARVTNLYGPWHGPRQGLINRLCTAAATREALQIYVPLDTVRDYIYVTDAARLLLLELETKSTAVDTLRSSVVLIGSGESSSVGSVINTVANVTHRKVPVTMAQLMETDLQPRDLRMLPSWVDHGLDFAPLTLTQGIKRLFDALVTVPRWSETDK
jgi:UDP-glucose 4-epimerase